MADECRWTGLSGKVYIYTIYPIDTTWKDVPGNYIFAKRSAPTTWAPVYIGETESFSDRLPNHNELPCIRRNGGTHIHVRVNNAGATARREEQDDILAKNPTPCNG